jgi:hypothetical protein
MRLSFTLFIFAVVLTTPTFAQKRILTAIQRDSVPFNNRKYKQELGIGVEGLFSYGPGSHLIWKIRDDRSKLIPVSYSYYWRIQAGANGNTFSGYRDSIVVPGYYSYTNTNPANSNNHVWASIGRERNNYANRFNFFYGWEGGLRFGYDHINQYVNIPLYNNAGGIVGSASVPIVTNVMSPGVFGGVFMGVKYHITDRISITAESLFSIYYTAVRRKVTTKVNDITTEMSPTWHHQYGYGLNYVRFISLNYRFKQY